MTRGRLKADCECVCHEPWGGSAHPKQKCRCKERGTGYEDLTKHLAFRLRRGLPLPQLDIAGDEITVRTTTEETP